MSSEVNNPNSSPDSSAVPDVEALQQEHPADVAAVIGSLPTEDGARLLSALPPETAADALAHLDAREAGEMLEDLHPDQVATTVEHMEPDDAADVLAELPDEHREQVLAALPVADRVQLKKLLAYPPETAGGMMSPEFVALPENLTVPQAIDRLREIADESEQVYYTYVVDGAGRLVGVLSLRDLILAPATRTVGQIMRRSVMSIPVGTDREEVAAQLEKYGYLAMPVVDAQNRLLGIVTIDDVVDVIQAEATEDMHRMVGAGADENIDSPVPLVWRRRIPWLLLNLGTAFLAASVVGAFESTLQQLTVLAVLLPIVAGQAGNTGMQSMAVMIRGIAMGETEGTRLSWVVLREMAIGLGMGVVIGLVCGAAAYVWRGELMLSVVLASAMVLCMLLATVSGAVIPWAMKRMGFDPAQSASIILTTVTDVTGFGIFLALGTLLLLHGR